MKVEISNPLLSWFFGFECEFVELDEWDLEIDIKYKEIDNDRNVIDRSFNLHNFKDLAKIKAYESGYRVLENVEFTEVKAVGNYKTLNDIMIDPSRSAFDIRNTLEALEYVLGEL